MLLMNGTGVGVLLTDRGRLRQVKSLRLVPLRPGHRPTINAGTSPGHLAAGHPPRHG
jgi:hypothetical protein